MTDTVIRVENLGKRYSLGQKQEGPRYQTLRDSISEALRTFGRRLRPRAAKCEPSASEFWALKDVSFDIKRGEVMGIIGRNGAGKSTLLKILSRITEPTEGRITIKGRVASLLEVGTGFHPELTGRENIFLNGAILGMHRAEIRAKFDEIVAFAEVERFLDTPVKRYSSGMYVRLAFAVAAHLEPEILIVDEVLAVGDAEFQKKCLGKMRDVAEGEGRTVLFVSHNMAAIRALCDKGVLLKEGLLELTGPIDEVASAYGSTNPATYRDHTVILDAPPARCSVWIESVTVLCNGIPNATLEFGDRLSLKIGFRASRPIKTPIIGLLIRSARGGNVINANNYYQGSNSYDEPLETGNIICDLSSVPLMADDYTVSFWLCRDPQEQHHVEDVLHFRVEEKDIWGTGRFPSRGLSFLWWTVGFEFTA